MLNKIILMFLIFVLVAPVSAAEYYSLDLNYNDGNISLISSPKMKIGGAETFSGNYVAKIISFENKILNTTFFEIPLIYLYDAVDPETGEIIGGNIAILNEINVTLNLPYYENAKSIEIYSPNNTKLLTINVSQFAKNLCGDGICQGYENAEKCPADCAKELLGEKEEAKETITQQIAKSVSKNYSYIVIAIAAIVLIIIITRFLKKRQKSQIEPQIHY